MATKLFLRNTLTLGRDNDGFIWQDMSSSAGSSLVSVTAPTSAGGTQIAFTNGTTQVNFVSGRVPAGGFTLSGTMTFNIWALESNNLANCGGRAFVYRYGLDGSFNEVAGGPWNDGVEFTTAAAVYNWTGTPTSTAFVENERIVVVYYITNVGTMGGGRTCTLNYNAATGGANGDSWFQINETVTFKADITPPAGSLLTMGVGL
jgi:hypothetical protein